MKFHPEPITQASQIIQLTEKLSKQTYLAFDTEFVRERTFFPELALIQVATEDEAWLIDPLALNKTQMQPFLEVLQNPKILKILHSAHGDQECLFSTYGITISPTLDTYEAASLAGYGESVSLRDLLQKTFQVQIPKFLTRTHWNQRPLSEEMQHYALVDVEYLVALAKRLEAELKKLDRWDWALELSSVLESAKLYQSNPKAMAERFAKSGKINSKRYPLFQDLIEWREKRARQLNLPRKRISDDETLMNIANIRPKNQDQLHKFRGLNNGEIRNQGRVLMEIIHRKRDKAPPFSLPTRARIRKPTPAQARVTDFLSTYLKTICQQHRIASRLVFTVKDLQRIVQDNLLKPEAWVEQEICSKRAADLVGEEIIAALLGKRTLVVENGELTIKSIH